MVPLDKHSFNNETSRLVLGTGALKNSEKLLKVHRLIECSNVKPLQSAAKYSKHTGILNELKRTARATYSIIIYFVPSKLLKHVYCIFKHNSIQNIILINAESIPAKHCSLALVKSMKLCPSGPVTCPARAWFLNSQSKVAKYLHE